MWTSADTPDNKLVEDVHQPIRLHSKGNVNRKQKSSRIQDIVANSSVLETRGVRNAGAVSRDKFLSEFKTTKTKPVSGMFKSRRHKLPEASWARMMHKDKTWASWSEDTIEKAAAAWHWLHYYVQEKVRGTLPANCTIGTARWSKLVLPETLMFDGERYFASLGNRVWGALASPLERVQQAEEDNNYDYKFTQSAIDYIHIVDPSKWQIIPYEPCRLESHGVVLKQTGQPLGLIKSSLMSAHNFTQKDLQMFAAFNELDGMHSNDDVFLLDILGNHLKDEDDSYPDLIKKKYIECTCKTSMLLRDPLMEMVFEDMDEDVLLWRGPSADNQ